MITSNGRTSLLGHNNDVPTPLTLPKARIIPTTLFVCTSDSRGSLFRRERRPCLPTKFPHLFHLLLSKLLPVTSLAQAGGCRSLARRLSPLGALHDAEGNEEVSKRL